MCGVCFKGHEWVCAVGKCRTILVVHRGGASLHIFSSHWVDIVLFVLNIETL